MKRRVTLTLVALVAAFFWSGAMALRAAPIENGNTALEDADLKSAGQNRVPALGGIRDLARRSAGPAIARRAAVLRVAQASEGATDTPGNNAGQVVPVSPYILRAGLGADGLELFGHVPGKAEHTALVVAARRHFKNRPVRVQVRLGRGAPADFQRVALYALSQLSRFRSGAIEIRDKRVSIAGETLTPGDYLGVLAALKALPARYRPGSIDVRPPRAARYSWSAEQTTSGLRLGGLIPDVRSRRKLLELVRAMFPNSRVKDEMVYASGAPNGLLGVAGYAMEMFLQLHNARAQVALGVLKLTGTPNTVAGYRTVKQALAAPPAGVTSVDATISPATARPFRWQVARMNKEVVFTGHVPDEATRKRVMKFAGRHFAKVEMVDTMIVANGAPENWLAAAKRAIQEASLLEFGAVVLSDRTFTITGRAPSARAARDIEAKMAKLMDGYTGAAALTHAPEPSSPPQPEKTPDAQAAGAPVDPPIPSVKPLTAKANPPVPLIKPPAIAARLAVAPDQPRAAIPDAGQGALARCRGEVATFLQTATFKFDSDSAAITSQTAPMIALLAKTLTGCGDVRIGIAGHTDSSGERDQNLVLSQKRADAVASRLAGHGIAKRRLTAAGFGSTRPIADNETVDGRTRNRRIEILIADDSAPLFTGTVPKIPDLAKRARRAARNRPARVIQNFSAEER